jgi:hypothetical protein
VFAEQCFEAKKHFYAWNSIFKRVFLSKTKFSLFRFIMVLLANVVSRKEIYQKQNRTLGE